MARRYRRISLVGANLGWHRTNADQGRHLPEQLPTNGRRYLPCSNRRCNRATARCSSTGCGPASSTAAGARTWIDDGRGPRAASRSCIRAVPADVRRCKPTTGPRGSIRPGAAAARNADRPAPRHAGARRDGDLGAAVALRASGGERCRRRHASGNPPAHMQPLMPTESTGLAAQHADRPHPVAAVQRRTATGAAETRGPPIGFPAGDHPTGSVTAMAADGDAVREGLQAAPVVEMPTRHGRGTPMPARPALHRHQT